MARENAIQNFNETINTINERINTILEGVNTNEQRRLPENITLDSFLNDFTEPSTVPEGTLVYRTDSYATFDQYLNSFNPDSTAPGIPDIINGGGNSLLGNLASSTEVTYDTTGNVTSTKNYTFAPEGHILNEVAIANGIETMSTYDTMGALTATGPSVNGQWNGGVRVFGDDGALSKVVVYTNGVEGASYDPATNTFSGVNFEGVMSTNDLTNFDSIVNSMRETGSLDFFEHPGNAKYGTLIETLDFVQAAGLPIEILADTSI